MADDDKFRGVFVDVPKITSIVASTSTATISFNKVFAPAVKALPEDHKIYSLVGRIASDWAHVEHTLDLAI
jgi:hypothetical protein